MGLLKANDLNGLPCIGNFQRNIDFSLLLVSLTAEDPHLIFRLHKQLAFLCDLNPFSAFEVPVVHTHPQVVLVLSIVQDETTLVFDVRDAVALHPPENHPVAFHVVVHHVAQVREERF